MRTLKDGCMHAWLNDWLNKVKHQEYWWVAGWLRWLTDWLVGRFIAWMVCVPVPAQHE